MPSDRLQDGDKTIASIGDEPESIIFKKTTSEDMKRRMDDPKDDIHRQIRSAIQTVLAKTKYASDHAFVEDLIQKISLKVWQKVESFEGESKLTSWIFAVARNTFRDELRSHKVMRLAKSDSIDQLNRDDEFDDSKDLESTSGLSENEIISKLDSKEFWEFLRAKITLHELLLLKMKFKEELTFSQIAKDLSIPPATAKTQFYALLNKVRKIYRVKNATK